MHPVLIYLFPALMDIVVSTAYFVGTVRAAAAGFSPAAVGAVIAAHAAAYMVTCLLTGAVLRPRNAAALTLAGCLVSALAAVGFVLLPALGLVCPLMGLLAVGNALFFVAFQVFMKCVDQGQAKPIGYSTGLYTFSWSAGFALGPFIAGFMWSRTGWQGSYLFCALAAVATAAGVFVLRHHAAPPAGPGPGPTPATPAAGAVTDPLYASLPDLAWMGWVCGGAGIFTISVVRAMFPLTGQLCDLSKPAQGTVFFVLSMTQALTGLALSRGRRWMYCPRPLRLLGLAGSAGLVAFALGRGTPAFLVAAVLYGVYAGAFYFYLVFHALVHPLHSPRYLAVNETVVGLTGMVAPVGAGLLAARAGTGTVYLAAILLIAAAVGLQGLVHRRTARLVAAADHPPAPTG